jgi:membrane-associated protease RseP (regulator of RpoE activity)
MPDYYSEPSYSVNFKTKKKKYNSNIIINIVLFIATFFTTTVAGVGWITGNIENYTLHALKLGLPYSISIIFILGTHEFGHYFAARYHKVKATLPFFIPIPTIPQLFLLNFGTMGAVIKTKSIIPNNKAMFDIGVSGPLAGFVACLIVLVYGFTHLPGVNYILSIHPDYFSPNYGSNALMLKFGDSFLFAFLRNLLTTSNQFVPPMSEIYHYPYLCVGWFGLFVTGMNMIPVGQLDGGHVVYSMFGSKLQKIISWVFMGVLVVIGLLGLADEVFSLNLEFGWVGWLLWCFILFFVIKVKHPPVYEFVKLDTRRMLIGYLSLFIFIISISPTPFYLK